MPLWSPAEVQPLIASSGANSRVGTWQHNQDIGDLREISFTADSSSESNVRSSPEQDGYVLVRPRQKLPSQELPRDPPSFFPTDVQARELQALRLDAEVDLIIRSPTQRSLPGSRDSAGKESRDLPEREIQHDDAQGEPVKVDLIDNWMHTTQQISAESVYGTALIMPQIARSAEWHPTLTMLSVRSYILLAVNIFMQFALLYQLNLESAVMNYYGSQPHLCNFGQFYDMCPGSPDCTGPGGTTYEIGGHVSRFSTWNMRVFARNSMLLLKPNRTETIHKNINPGEYGVQSPLCRDICVFLFVLLVMDDLIDTFDLVLVLCCIIPTNDAMWISYEAPEFTTKETDRDIYGHGEFDYVHFDVQGMPLHWKLLNMALIVLPKCLIWLILAFGGTVFLMETAGIQDVILNGLALAFILEVDELVAFRFESETTLCIMGKLRQYSGPPVRDANTEHGCISFAKKLCKYWHLLQVWVPKRLIASFGLTWATLWLYYARFCEKTADGSYISKPLYPPKEIERFGSWFIKWLVNPSSIERVDTPTWQMEN